MIGGGISSESELAFDGSWSTQLVLRDFVVAPPKGEYQLSFAYHDQIEIDSSPDLSGLVVFRSKPIILVIRPTELQLTKKEVVEIVKLVSEIPPTLPVHVVAGTFGEWAHELVSPDSSAGKVLLLGMKAIPFLLKRLDEPSLTVERRAWILSLLFTLTGENDPRGSLLSDGPALGYHYYIESGFSVFGGFGESSQGGGLSLPRSNLPNFERRYDTSGDKHEPQSPFLKEFAELFKSIGEEEEARNRKNRPVLDAQLELVRQWKSWHEEFELTIVD
jgi:hypothetical protein